MIALKPGGCARRTHRRTAAITVLVGAVGALGVSACGDSSRRVEVRAWTGSTTDSSGITVVANPTEGLWEDGAGWAVHEELRIGSFAADPDQQFAQVGGIAVNSRGEILVMDRQLRELRFFSSEGEYLRAVGTPGSGPGEFGRGVSDVFVADDDSFLVPDPRNRRVHHFDPEGALLGSAPLDVERYRALRFRGHAGARRAAVQLRPTDVLVDDGLETSDGLHLLGVDGEVGEALVHVPSGRLLGPDVVRYFTPEVAWALTDSLTILYARNSDYAIHAFDRDGRLRRIVRRAFEPRPITDRDIRAFFAYLDRAWLDAGVPPSRLPENRARVSFAEVFPAFYQFEVGLEGSLWVQPIRPPGELSDAEIERYNFIEDFGSSGWEVFDREGRFLGTVTMPPRFQPRLFLDDRIYGVVRDDADVPYVARLRIERPGPDGAFTPAS